MTTAYPSRPNTRLSKSRKAPGETELLALFHLFPQPAILVDNAREQIIQVNSSLLQMTAFATTEIVGSALRDILHGLPEHALAVDDLSGLLLDRRNRNPQTVNVQIRILDGPGQWLVLFVEPQEEPRRNLLLRIDQVFQTLVDMNGFSEDEPVRKNLERMANLVLGLMEVAVVGIYRVDDYSAGLWKAAEVGESDVLPDTISANEMIRLSNTYIWRPGRRVQTDLHRAARVKNLSFLASTPIIPSGMLVIADRRQEPPEHLMMVLEAFARQVGAVLKHQPQLIELRRLALENRRDLSIWRSVAENAQEGILLLAPDLTVSEMNPAAEWMLGYADWEVKGQPVENILIGPERLVPALETACQGIPTHNMGSVSLHRRNGQSFPAHMQIVPAQREGETLAIFIFFGDVSEHVEIRNRTQQLEQRAVLGEVTAVFAHEVRNPINNISTGLQLLSVKLPENDSNQENISRLIVDCQRLNHLMESVLSFSRYSEHKFESVELEPLLHRLLDRWRPRMAKVSVTHFFHVEENTPPILGDPKLLDQVFTNLISNAVEAMGSSGGTLAVRVAPFHVGQGRPQVEVTVSDNGPGVPDEVKDRIFEPFVTTKAQGTGLGLAITKRIVTAHRGSISVNTFPGGTVFHVLLSAYQGESG
jgi:two-component system, NtrC family, sensor histidine kinase AtoS